MITGMRANNFKSWRDTGEIRLAPITGFFGTNSSGKTAILQLLLMLKQTVESSDRSTVLHTGNASTYVELGTFYDFVYRHESPGQIEFELAWRPSAPLSIKDPENPKAGLFDVTQLSFFATILGDPKKVLVEEFIYKFQHDNSINRFGMRRQTKAKGEPAYEVINEGYELARFQGRPTTYVRPTKFYGFPDQVVAQYKNAGFLSQLVLALEEQLQSVYYLGPLRENPHRSYVWAGEQPQDVGRRGELAVPALLASAAQGRKIKKSARKSVSVQERVAEWLKELGMVHSFSLAPIAENRNDYEVRVRRSASAPEVQITDVGFGISQILPVITLCYYAPEGATLLLEQPEIHLHPAVQAGLADVFVDAVKTRGIQIILESHSEHLLRRLQRRIAEEQLTPKQVSLNFVEATNGESRLSPLDVDLFGNISNWPAGFFGDELGDLVAMTEAAARRERSANGSTDR